MAMSMDRFVPEVFQPNLCLSFQNLFLHLLTSYILFSPVRIKVVNLIRLVKTKDSHIPSQLLIDLDLSEQGLKDDMNGIASLARSMSSSSLEVSGATKLTLQKQLNSGKKMMIMKRNNKDPRTSRKNESKSDGKKKKHNLKGKKMDEKEKAYAEVRARIFGESSGSTRNSSGTSSPPTRSSPGIASSPPLPEPQSQLIESDAQSSKREPRNTRMSSHNNNLNDTSREGDGGNVTKARYRNRMQEENDPDFRRGRVAVPMQYGHAYGGIYNDAYPVAASASAGVYTQGSGSGSYQHLQQTMYYSSGQQYVMGRQGYAYSQQQTQSAYHHTYYRGEQQEQSAPNEGSSDYAAIGVNGNGKSIYQNEFPELGR
uniref:SUZ domain-containing protein n=1 Tax=Corethron hystrix TaxID=216773 RepID=A0A7S1FRP1_9STRA|mmetsp:Transcript_23486/g.53587  ORF Transcript_23486/g.53587 Transcript_23486/m.53587 type:complete len:370 (+) Transcript_23486:1256-2365(+)